MTRSIRHSRIKLVVVFALFLGPLLFSFLWYYGLGAAFFPQSKTNYAPLITPVATLAPFADQFDNGEPFTLASLKRKWTLFHVIPSACGEDCQTSLYNTRQTRAAVGKDANRIQRIGLVNDGAPDPTIETHHPDLRLVSNNTTGVFSQLQQIMSQEGIGPNDAILVDPLGNAMMFVPAALEPRLLLKDLKKLLRLSRVG